MKKVIKIHKELIDNIEYFVFSSDNNELLFNVDCSTKTIKGKELFEKIYNSELNDIIEVSIDQDLLSPEDKKSFGNYVEDLFNSINKSMNQQFGSGEQNK